MSKFLRPLNADDRIVSKLDGEYIGERMAITFPDSSAIRHAVFNLSTGALALRYTSGGEYVYHAVTARVVLELLVSDSAGVYVNRYIKSQYRSKRIYASDNVVARMAGAI